MKTKSLKPRIAAPVKRENAATASVADAMAVTASEQLIPVSSWRPPDLWNFYDAVQKQI